jgi:hypothetical protein
MSISVTPKAQMQRARYCAARFGLTIRKIAEGGYILADKKQAVTNILTFAELQKCLVNLQIDELKNSIKE